MKRKISNKGEALIGLQSDDLYGKGAGKEGSYELFCHAP